MYPAGGCGEEAEIGFTRRRRCAGLRERATDTDMSSVNWRISEEVSRAHIVYGALRAMRWAEVV